jgi:hypothetical protein
VIFRTTAVYGSLNGLRWTKTVGDSDSRVVLGEARVGVVRMTDAMVFELEPEGRIQRISPHLRPWLALTLFAALIGPKVGPFRALRRPGSRCRTDERNGRRKTYGGYE